MPASSAPPALPRRRAASVAAALAIALLPAAAHAVRGYDNFTATPIAKFSKEDSALMMARVDPALKAEKDGEKLDWKNPATPASGSVTPLSRLTANGLPCRRLRVANAYGDLKAEGVYRFCEKPPGTWKLIGPDTGS